MVIPMCWQLLEDDRRRPRKLHERALIVSLLFKSLPVVPVLLRGPQPVLEVPRRVPEVGERALSELRDGQRLARRG